MRHEWVGNVGSEVKDLELKGAWIDEIQISSSRK